MISYDISSSIEGLKFFLQCRQFMLHIPYVHEILGRVYPFKLGIYGKAIIEKELNPKEPKINSNSILDEGSGIEGNSIEGFSTKLPSSPQIKIATARHSASFIQTKKYSFAQIIVPLSNLLQKNPD